MYNLCEECIWFITYSQWRCICQIGQGRRSRLGVSSQVYSFLFVRSLSECHVVSTSSSIKERATFAPTLIEKGICQSPTSCWSLFRLFTARLANLSECNIIFLVTVMYMTRQYDYIVWYFGDVHAYHSWVSSQLKYDSSELAIASHWILLLAHWILYATLDFVFSKSNVGFYSWDFVRGTGFYSWDHNLIVGT